MSKTYTWRPSGGYYYNTSGTTVDAGDNYYYSSNRAFRIRLGISCGDYGADGEFGDCTEMAVIAYQKQHALEPDGEYGPLTHASLTAELERLENPAQQNCVRIVGGNCYVRVEPNTEAEKLGVAHRDTLLPYQGETAANGWLKVAFGGRDGWVSGKYGRICG